MRRAMRPAICLTRMRFEPLSMPTDDLLVLEARLVVRGVEKLARSCS